ncbi:MAG: hypothetical protein ACYC39_14790, partial [Thiobacillus sp.]
ILAALGDQTHGALADFGGILYGFLHGSIFSRVGASSKSGAVHAEIDESGYDSATTRKAANWRKHISRCAHEHASPHNSDHPDVARQERCYSLRMVESLARSSKIFDKSWSAFTNLNPASNPC